MPGLPAYEVRFGHEGRYAHEVAHEVGQARKVDSWPQSPEMTSHSLEASFPEKLQAIGEVVSTRLASHLLGVAHERGLVHNPSKAISGVKSWWAKNSQLRCPIEDGGNPSFPLSSSLTYSVAHRADGDACA